MKREDFKNPMDWVIYKVNGRMPKPQKKRDVGIENNMLPKNDRKYGLKFYRNQNGRYSVMYHKEYLCMCSYEDIQDIQKYFDENFNGKNAKQMSKELKGKYNQKIRSVKRGIKGKPYSQNRLNFQKKDGGRLCARVNDKGKVHTICQCYENQKKEVSDTYDMLKESNSIDTIKEIMKDRYNIIGRNNKKANLNNHQINITKDGAIYKNGEFITVDSKVYDFIDNYIMK